MVQNIGFAFLSFASLYVQYINESQMMAKIKTMPYIRFFHKGSLKKFNILSKYFRKSMSPPKEYVQDWL